ncbi:Aldehyde/histidinol dehydrogenase [Dendryphion nanum]|uniref:Aldehyde/histidinol dehydrogenase n=1 Tax=Dendryphion nanum TaxID=256645 RepID=A0A9P9EE41_9PLEO|nr:Aldehyde/histidinol dehydrogenase [Dendryphion nanum]
MSAQDILERVDIAWIEGRLENVLERQKQLAALHQQIEQRFENIVIALQQDLRRTKESATAEVVIALNAINALYEQLNFQELLAKERRLKNGGDVVSFLVPLGKTLVVQLGSCPVISTLCPLAAALAAGNPTILLGSHASPVTNNIVEQVIWYSLDREAFHFEKDDGKSTHQTIAKGSFSIVVLPDLETSRTIGSLVRANNASARQIEPYFGMAAGIIDRSAKSSLDASAEQIRRSVLVGATSNPLRVPRLFFVDESVISVFKSKLQFAKEKKGTSLEDWLRKYYMGLTSIFSTKDSPIRTKSKFPSVCDFTLISFTNGAEIALVSTRSLDHSIDLLNKINSGTGSQALYVFADGKEAFYLGNFITTSHVFINEIPTRSLVLSTSRSVKDTVSCPYILEDFSETKTMVQAPVSRSLSDLRRPGKLDAKKVKQHQGGRMSYFEQGLILGAAMGLVALAGFSILSYRGVRTYLLR